MSLGLSERRKVVLLIDADNVSIDVIEQAVAQLLTEHGALHVRRAYGTAESAVKHQAAFKRLGIRPMVNLAAGKNSTDIALAVDAIDLAIAERPDVVAIASSDSDFAPLVAKLREKGCRVVGLGQAGKTGDETVAVYDAFTVLAHRKAGVAGAAATGAVRSPAKTARAAKSPARRRTAAAPAPTPTSAPAPAPVEAAAAVDVPAPPAGPSPSEPASPASRAERTPARKTGRRKTASAPAAGTPDTGPSAAPAAARLEQILTALPELGRGDTVELRLAAERLREAGLIGRNGSSTKAFGAYPEHFELVPARNPNKVRLRG